MSKALNIPIRIDPLFMILVLFLSLFNGNFIVTNVLLWAIVIIFSVLFHEFGHALTALAFGQRASIQLVGFGGLTTRQGPPLKPLQEFILVLNGPLASLLLAGLAGLLYKNLGSQLPTTAVYLLQITTYANIFWTFLNLLPIQPLDGGQLMRILLTSLFGLRGTKIALFLSFLFAFAIAVLLFVNNQFLLGSFFLLFTFEAYRAWQSSLPLTDQDSDVELLRMLKQGEKEQQKENYEAALQRFVAVREQSSSGVLFQKATAHMAEIYMHQERYQEAYNLLIPTVDKLDINEQVLLQQLCFHLKRWKETIVLGNKIYRYNPLVEVAITNALSHGNLGEAGPAIGWIHCAIREGKQDTTALLKRHEFDSIRRDRRFKDLEGKG